MSFTNGAFSDLLEERDQLKWKVRKYEDFLHSLNYAMIGGDHMRVGKLLDNARKWSYVYRRGNGEYSEEEQQSIINNALEHLMDD